jgi:hypothetical protein
MISPETTTKLNTLRQKMAQGLEVTMEEQIEAVRLLRADRFGAAVGSAKAATKRTAAKKAADINGDDLLGELMG